MSYQISQIIEQFSDKKSWKVLKFSDVAENIAEKITPKRSSLKHYIGLEHLDSGSLHIKRFGDPQSIEGDKLKIYANDIIFAKRNAYLKRVAVAKFDAIASAHSLVLRPKSDNIVPEFLAYFMLSDMFWERAIEISVGSLSPTINWKVLAKQEFLLPSMKEQIELLNLFTSLDCAIEAKKKLLAKKIRFNLAKQKQFFESEHYSKHGIMQLALVQRGRFTPRPRNDPQFFGGEIPFIQTAEVIETEHLIKRHKQTLNEKGLAVSKLFSKGTIVMAIAGTYVGSCGVLDFDSAFTDSLLGIQSDSSVLMQEYLFYYMRFNEKKIDSLATEVAQRNLSIDSFKAFKVSYPAAFEEQKYIVDSIYEMDVTQNSIRDNIDLMDQLFESIINKVF